MMSRRGFTLLEVLMALVIFAVAAVMMGAAYVNVLNAYDIVGRGNFRSEDVSFARQQLLAESDREKAEEGSDFEGADGARVTWRATIEQTQLPDLFRVEFICEVAATTAGQPQPAPAREVFFLLRPSWSQGLDTTQLKQDAKERILELGKMTPR